MDLVKVKKTVNRVGFILGIAGSTAFVLTGGDFSSIQGKVTLITSVVGSVLVLIRELLK